MYRSTSLACVACHTALVPLEGAPFAAHVCPACGGAWLAPEAAVHVMRGLGDVPTGQLTAVTAQAAKQATVAVTRDAPGRACPTCSAALTPMTVAGVSVDCCVAHGTWFDREEVGTVASACQKLREQGEGEAETGATSSPSITFEGVIEGTAQVGYGITKAAVTLVVDLFTAIVRHAERERERDRYR